MRLTIERLRTMVLAAGVLLIVALGVFLGVAKFRNPFNRKDLPHRLGLNIQQEANGFVYTHEVRGHTLYKIRASKQVQLKKEGQILLQLHDVKIELYGEDGSRVDRIEGADFEYDPKAGEARAPGAVEITLMRPQVAPAGAPAASSGHALNDATMNSTLTAAAQTASGGEIHVITSGLVFDRNTGSASTSKRVDFEVKQGNGSAMGAAYDANKGRLTLDHAVELMTSRGSEPITLHAQHAEFERDNQVCALRSATLSYRNAQSSAQVANVYFRDDGSADHLDAQEGFSLVTPTGGRLAAPQGTLKFDAHNQPQMGHLQGGVTIDSDSQGRHLHGTSPTMDMRFAPNGGLRNAHLERGVQILSDEQTGSANDAQQTHRSWTAPVVDVEFRNSSKGRVEPASIHGMGGVVVTAESRRGNQQMSPSRMTAEDVVGTFGANGGLTAIEGTGHASIEQTTVKGTRQTTTGDKLVAHLATASGEAKGTDRTQAAGGMQIESATVQGNVVLLQQPAARSNAQAESTLRATAGQAVYESAGEWLHLTESPRVVDGALQLAADKIDVSQQSGDAFAHGSVKATWLGNSMADAGQQKKGIAVPENAMFGAQGPAHAVAAEARLQRATGEATFQGKARLWQQGNSVAAPVIVLDRIRQTLTARSTNKAEPVQVVMVSAAAITGMQHAAKPGEPSVIRVRGSDLKYSSAERKAVMHGGAAGNVVATTADASTVSNEMELILLPPGNHAGKDGAPAQVDRMTSSGDVVVAAQGRRGIGQKIVYSSETGNYVLTGTAEAPPRITDPARGTVTGEALIFNSRDDSVSIEGGGRRTTTVTTAPK